MNGLIEIDCRFRDLTFITFFLSGEKETDKIISKFIKEEEENYALFNYVNELSHEIEQLNETVQQLQDSIGN